MPAVRLSRRRKSSHALFTPAKPGIYGIPQRPVTFAPNVTPITFVDTEDSLDTLSSALSSGSPSSTTSPTATLFPPSSTPAPPPARKRCPPGKRRSQGYIPRPPNAFMLFRADFVRQKHVPGSIETNHGSLSKIIGTCWRQLPLEEKRVWEVRARQEKANHKAMFPDYRFRPVHNKNKGGSAANGNGNGERKEKNPTTFEDERRCEEVAQLLLEGKKGDELARAVRTLDMERERELSQIEMMSRRDSYSGENAPDTGSEASPGGGLHMHMPLPMSVVPQHMLSHNHNQFGNGQFSNQHMYMRRPSSVPLPNEFYASYPGAAGGIAMPALPFLQSLSRSESPVASISRQAQTQQFPSYRESFSAFFQPSHAASTHDFSYAHPHTTTETEFASYAFSNPFGPTTALPPPPPTNSLAGTLFTPGFSPGFASGFGHPTLAQRNSLGGLGRRASSAQPIGAIRSWGEMNFVDGGNHHAYMQTQQMMLEQLRMDGGMVMERDHSPLPDVEPELFAPDFSFGASSTTPAHPANADNADPASTANTGMLSSSSTSPSSSGDHALSVSPIQRPGPLDPGAPVPVSYAPHHGHSHSHSRSMDGMYAPDQYVPEEPAYVHAHEGVYGHHPQGEVYTQAQSEAVVYSQESGVYAQEEGMWAGDEMATKGAGMMHGEMGVGVGVPMGMEYYEGVY